LANCPIAPPYGCGSDHERRKDIFQNGINSRSQNEAKGVKISFYALEVKKRACLANDKIAISHFKIQDIPWLPSPLHTTLFMINSISCLHFWTFYKFKELFIYKEYGTIAKRFIF